MSWSCQSCDTNLSVACSDKEYVWTDATGWLCGECREAVDWKQHRDWEDDGR